MATKKHKFNIDIGDWSSDGHGKCKSFLFESSHSVEDVREAYFAAGKKLKKNWPEEVCHDYGDYSVTAEVLRELKQVGFEFKDCDFDGEEGADDEVCYPSEEGMLQLTVWFIKQGNPEIKLKQISTPKVPSLAFYGFDKKKRHIGFIGYGIYDI